MTSIVVDDRKRSPTHNSGKHCETRNRKKKQTENESAYDKLY